MKDRYLFRGKRIDNGEWVEGLLTIMWGQIHIIKPTDENTAYPIDVSTICQCTGLKDKNGKLIFEGDVVRHYNNPSYPNLFDVGLIVYQEDSPGFERTSRMHDDDNVGINTDCIYEIIGNKFDNPELLEVQE